MIAALRPAIAAALLLPPLSGCVAAAIPVLAAGGVIKTQADRRGDRAPSGQPRVALPADPARVAADGGTGPLADRETAPPAVIVRDYAFADGTMVTVTNAVTSAPREFEPPPAPSLTPPVAPAESSTATLLTGMAGLPAPSSPSPAPRTAAPGSGFADFAAFARAQAAIPAAGAERRSAILADSGRLVPETRLCSIHPGAILIALDPAGGALDTARPLAADPGFAAGLADLRSEGVEIGWISARTADRAGAIRKALVASGLDPDGRDELVLLRFPEERKQTRREEFAKANCVLAIAGDERADFDELFAYLRDPAAATPLDSLIGKGWFLVPPPLN
jgi:hypothetical protein